MVNDGNMSTPENFSPLPSVTKRQSNDRHKLTSSSPLIKEQKHGMMNKRHMESGLVFQHIEHDELSHKAPPILV